MFEKIVLKPNEYQLVYAPDGWGIEKESQVWYILSIPIVRKFSFLFNFILIIQKLVWTYSNVTSWDLNL